MNEPNHPKIIRTIEDAAMVSGYIVNNKINNVNGIAVSAMMNSKKGRVTLSEWVWIERKTVNDWLKAQ